MGRWDKDKDKSDLSAYKTALTDEDLQKIRSNCRGMTESEKDEVVSQIAQTYSYIREMLVKNDDSVVDYNRVLAIASLLYCEYERLSSPPAILVSCVEIARKNHFNVNTFKKMIVVVHRLLDDRFLSPSDCFGTDSETGTKDFKFEV